EIGIPLTMEEVTYGEDKSVITRAHFARALVRKGIVNIPSEAFDKYLGYDCPCFVPRNYMEPEDAIKLILKAGGVPTLAHPFLYGLGYEELFSLIGRLKDAGLMGLETFYSKNKGDDLDTAKGLADHFGLLMTGGSDFHGAVKPGLEIGCGYGDLFVPHNLVDILKKAARQ
ncbi:MAG: PHP domain-containing protein, partial [Lachnospiraceae bacterium]|nr:PHP domain-containing protein [Lachnospiraceae bacterium]